MRFRSTIVASLVIVLACVFAGCSGGAPEGKSGSPVIAVEPMAHDERASLPETFPIEIPVVSGSIITTEDASEAGTSGGPWRIVIETSADAAAVAQWYRTAFVSRSWEGPGERDMPGTTVLSFVKGAGAWATVTITQLADRTRVEMWVGIGSAVPPEALPSGEPPVTL